MPYDAMYVGCSASSAITVGSCAIGVSTPHGWIELTRILYGPSSIAADLVRPTIPCLAAL